MKQKSYIDINVFLHNHDQVYPTYLYFFFFENHIELLLINENKCHYVYIKGFNNIMYNKAKHKDKNTFYMNCLQSFNGK